MAEYFRSHIETGDGRACAFGITNGCGIGDGGGFGAGSCGLQEMTIENGTGGGMVRSPCPPIITPTEILMEGAHT